MQEFFVANNRVDIPRNQIVREGEVIALEPKVLEVLRVLAENQGEVVSHQTLLDAVWPDIVVAPNALQRCIGQLRKALNDDGKAQRVIATHPKKGYSLLAPVTIRSTASGSGISRHPDSFSHKKRPFLGFAVAAVILVAVIFLVGKISSDTSQPLQKFTRLSPITATDASEFYSTFSPDGRYVAFSRKVSGLLGHMWVLDRETGREIRLTQETGSYGKPIWSNDGKQLAFLETPQCEVDCQFKPCRDINLIFMPLALTEPQPPQKLQKCLNIPFLGLEWIDDKQLAAILINDSGSSIIKVDSQTGDSKTTFEAKDTRLYSLSYSPAKSSLVVMQVKHQQRPSMFLLSPEDGVTKEQVFTPPKRYNSEIRWAPVWDHAGEHFLFSAGSRLFLMDLAGKLHSQSIPTFEDISYPMFHPDGGSIAMTLGKIDTDVSELVLQESQDVQPPITFSETPFARSILRESHAQYQPNGDKIAFFSKRGGTRQIWLTDNNPLSEHQTVFQLSHIEDLFPEHFVWSPNGQHLAVSTEHKVMLLDLQGKMQPLNLPFRLSRLYQWLPGDELLMQILDNDEHKLVRYKIADGSYNEIENTQSLWAQSNSDTTWFIDSERHLRKVDSTSSELVSTISHIRVGARFYLRGQQLFILASNDDVWRYDWVTNKVQRLFHYPNTTVHLTDVSNNGMQMLISKQLSAKKEIVLLTP